MSSENSIVFGVPFFHVEGDSPNVKRGIIGGNEAKYSSFYQCMLVFFDSVKNFFPSSQCVLFTNRNLPEAYQRLFDKLGVVIQILPEKQLKYVVDDRVHNAFPGCLFLLDVISSVVEESSCMGRSYMFFDGDCLVKRGGNDFFEDMLPSEKIAGYSLSYPFSQVVNHQSRASLAYVLNKNSEAFNAEFQYYGGEFLSFNVDKFGKQLAGKIGFWWENLLKESEVVGSSFTEEHVLSLALNEMGPSDVHCASKISRVWTDDKFHNIDERLDDLCVVHLPSEKKRFFRQLYVRKIESGVSDDYNDLLESYLSSYLGKKALYQLRAKLFAIVKVILNK